MKSLLTYKVEIHDAFWEGSLSYVIRYAEIIAETKAEAMRLAAQSCKHFKRCKIEQSALAAPDAVKGVQWIK